MTTFFEKSKLTTIYRKTEATLDAHWAIDNSQIQAAHALKCQSNTIYGEIGMNNVIGRIPLIAFCLYFGKLFVNSGSSIDAAILLTLAVTSAFFEYKHSEPKFKALEAQLNAFQKDLELKTKEIEGLKSSVSSMKLGSSLRPSGNIGR